MKLKRALLGALTLFPLVIGGCAVVLGAPTSYHEQPLAYVGRGMGETEPPSWTRPCRRYDSRYRRAYVLPCARVQGVVFYRQEHDPDGDGDIHALVAAGPHLVTVKSDGSEGSTGGLPGIGHRVDLAGTVTEGRFGLPVVDIGRR